MTKMFLIAAALTSFAMPAMAEPVTVNISAANLDLTTLEGRAELAKRADKAARDACGTASAADLKGKQIVRECREAVLEGVARHAAAERMAEASR